DAESAGRARLMVMVRRRVEHGRRMTPSAKRCDVSYESRYMRLVAVAAHDARPVHRALHERAVDEDLVEDLAVRMVEPFLETRRDEAIEQRLARRERIVELRAPGMTLRAHVDLPRRRRRPGALRRRRRVAAPPGPLGRREPRAHAVRPRGVLRSRSVACLAADVDLGPPRLEAILVRQVPLLE